MSEKYLEQFWRRVYAVTDGHLKTLREVAERKAAARQPSAPVVVGVDTGAKPDYTAIWTPAHD